MKLKQRKHIIINHILKVAFSCLFLSQTIATASAQKTAQMNLTFVNIESEKIKNAFIEVVSKYEILHDFNLVLVQKRIKSSTMQAQPNLNWSSLTKGIKSYKVKLGIYVRDSDTLRVDALPHEVLVGWFAHELGHIVDYGGYSFWQMFGYGIKYATSPKFKKKAEFAADVIAISHGFAPQIIAAKNFILNNELMDQGYKDKIAKYYMSIEEVNLCVEDKAMAEPAN